MWNSLYLENYYLGFTWKLIAVKLESEISLFLQKEILFIGENSILAPDFMYYMGQLLSMLKLDHSILAISALNENGMNMILKLNFSCIKTNIYIEITFCIYF